MAIADIVAPVSSVSGLNSHRRKSYARIRDIHEIPNLIEVQIDSFRWFLEEGLKELFDEVSPISSFNGNLELHLPGTDEDFNQQWGLGYRFEEPKYDEVECRERDMSYAAPLYVKVMLHNKETDQRLVQDVYMGDFPLMTENGTFVINGAERVVVSQLIRSPGAYFTIEEDRPTGRLLAQAKLIPTGEPGSSLRRQSATSFRSRWTASARSR